MLPLQSGLAGLSDRTQDTVSTQYEGPTGGSACSCPLSHVRNQETVPSALLQPRVCPECVPPSSAARPLARTPSFLPETPVLTVLTYHPGVSPLPDLQPGDPPRLPPGSA